LRVARNAGNAASERDALGKLLAPYWEWARSIAYGRLAGVSDRAGEAEVIAQQLTLRLYRALARKTEFEHPFHVVARVNLRWVIDTFWQKKSSNGSDAVDPTDMPDVEVADDETQSVDMQLIQFAPWLDGLGERDRKLLWERIFFDLSPETVAAHLGIEPNAVNVAFFRALGRARRNQPAPDVIDPTEGAA
ncbi:MAG TPA: sigma-70 family RNA polymerase sigma factor, partial [Polyangiaceae bacterium]|nr:sigma-70 family RNA polymerase sigma factor [Polyangiaceae bacterium]